MVERRKSFGADDSDAKDSQTEIVDHQHHAVHDAEAATSPSVASTGSSAIIGRFDDAEEILSSGDPASVQLPLGADHPDLSISGLTETHSSSPVDAPTQRIWSDEAVEVRARKLLTSTNEEDLNVLDLRQRWEEAPVPDTHQLNRVLYQMRDKGEIEQLPPNGKKQKPCWRMIVK